MRYLLYLSVCAGTAFAQVDFAKQVQPILEKHCTGCHGGERGIGGLKLNTRANAARAIVAGDPAKSPLLRTMETAPGQPLAMPPGGPQVPAAERELVRQWLAAGAPWPANLEIGKPAANKPKDDIALARKIAERIGKQVSSVLEDDLKPALNEIKEAMTKVNKDALSKDTIDKFKNGMVKLDSTLTRVDEKLLNEENATKLKEAIAELKEAATSFKNASKAIEDSSKKISPLIDKLDAPIAKVDKAMSTADDAMKSIKEAADSFAVAAKNITNGKGLLGALINDPQMKADFRDLIYNAKVNGFVWYKNTAEKERAKQQPAPQPEPAKRKSLSGPSPRQELSMTFNA